MGPTYLESHFKSKLLYFMEEYMHRYLQKKHLFLGLSLLFSGSLWAQTFHGQLEIMFADDFKNNHASKIYKLREGDISYELVLPANIQLPPLAPGDVVTVEGEESTVLKRSQIKVESIVLESKHKISKKKEFLAEPTVLTLLVNFTDKKATNTTSISAIDDQLYLSTTSAKANFIKSSTGQIKLKRDTNGDGQADIYVMNVDTSAGNACSPYTWADSALAAAEQSGINLDNYKHFVYVLPENVSCPWSGFGSFQCSSSSFACEVWVKAFSNTSFVLAHELGHNFGADHSSLDVNNDGSNDSEYGDSSCFMGNGGYRQLNAVHRDQLNFFNDFPKKIKTIVKSTKLSIFSLDKNKNRLQIVRINRPDLQGMYYVSFRTAHGPFGMGTTYMNKVNIHHTLPSDEHSYFVTALSAGQTFNDTTNGIAINVIEILEGKAVIRLTIPSTT